MGTTTYHIGDRWHWKHSIPAAGSADPEAREFVEPPEALARLRALASAIGFEAAESADAEDLLAMFDMCDWFTLSGSRLDWFEADETHGQGEGFGIEVVGRLVADLIAPGSWMMFDTDGEGWGIVFDGSRSETVELRPVAPEGVVLL